MKLYVVAGEESGDIHAGNLLSELRKECSTINVRGFGGDNMISSGATIVKHINTLSFMGITEVLKNLWKVYENLRFCKKDIIRFQPKAIILIDYPGFNLKIAKFAKKNGIKVFYYISPKVWAWNKNRIKLIRDYVDELVVIFPFEVDFFKQNGIQSHYFGNPIYEEVNKVRSPIGIKTNKKIIALLPGSRKQEVYQNLPVMMRIIPLFPEYKFIIASVSSTQNLCKELSKSSEVDVINEKTYSILNISEAAIVTSGTATLETALLNVPQLVCYKTDFITYNLAKLFINIKWISLVNIIMNKTVVKEFIQSQMTIKNLQNELRYLFSNQGRNNIFSDYKSLQLKLNSSNVSKKVAEFILRKV